MGKGSSRNEQKISEFGESDTKRRESEARKKLKAYRSIPVTGRDVNFDETIRRLRGILKRAITDGRKSEAHSRKGKAARR
jgi:hypothetical protein